MSNGEKAFVSWSGGKDCCLAAYLARRQGYDLQYLINTVTEDGLRSCSHGIASRWIRVQSDALEIPVIQERTTTTNYEEAFVRTLSELREKGITTGVFGDIDFLPHLDWIQKVCDKAGIKPVLPLWGTNQTKILDGFVESGFKAVVVATQANVLGEEWLGRVIDRQFIIDLAGLGGRISPCGEAGEYHSLVIDGPVFKKRLQIGETQKLRRGDNWFLEILRCELVEKDHSDPGRGAER